MSEEKLTIQNFKYLCYFHVPHGEYLLIHLKQGNVFFNVVIGILRVTSEGPIPQYIQCFVLYKILTDRTFIF